MSGHFWSDAPTVSWPSYLYRRVLNLLSPPTLLKLTPTLSHTQYPVLKGYTFFPASFRKARDYSEFLKAEFYFGRADVKLAIPHQILERHLEDQSWSGVELRNSTTGQLIGLAIQKRCLQPYPFPVACVEWISIHHSHRGKGLADFLLRALYVFSVQQLTPAIYAHTFRKEGKLLRIPSIKTETILLRKRLHRPKGSISYTIQEHSSGTITFSTGPVTLHLQPTYEVLNGLHTYEILYWSAEKATAYTFEEFIDALPLYIQALYAPSEFPHLDSLGWQVQGQQTWYAFHYDPGYPEQLIRY